MSTEVLEFKLSSENHFRNVTIEFPSRCGDIRDVLKRILGLSAPLELVLYRMLADSLSEGSLISDEEVIPNGKTKMIVRRLPEAVARKLLQDAAEEYRNTFSACDKECNSVREDRPRPPVDPGCPAEDTKVPSETCGSNLAVSSNDDGPSVEDEEDLIDRMIAAHAMHRGPANLDVDSEPPESLAQRYHRNKNCNWTWTRDGGESLPGFGRHQMTTQPQRFGYGPHPRHHSDRRQHPYADASSGFAIPVSRDYVCHMCGRLGHHIKNCPRGQDPRNIKRIKPATGIPRSWLAIIKAEEIPSIDKDSEIYCLADGRFAILKDIETVSSASYFATSVSQKLFQRYGEGGAQAEAHLRCPLCTKLFRNAMLTPCCGETYCQSCCVQYLQSSASFLSGSVQKTDVGSGIRSGNSTAGNNRAVVVGKHNSNMCPSCGGAVLPSELVRNETVQNAVDAVLKAKKYIDEKHQHRQSVAAQEARTRHTEELLAEDRSQAFIEKAEQD